MSKNIKAMIVSVGGTPAPIIFSLNESQPEYICFFASTDTKDMIHEQILPNLRFKFRHYEWIITKNPQILSECYEVLIRKLPEIIQKWEVNPQEVCVDFTGGTKTMSAALVLATVEKSCFFSYVGGDERSKGGVGIVLNGKEKMWFLDNPWDKIALSERREVSILFNKARYRSACEILEKCIDKVSLNQKAYLKALRDMVMGYDLWDRFKHNEGKNKLYACLDVLQTAADFSDRDEDKNLVSQIRENIKFLKLLVSGDKPSILYFYDLLANARRRAELEDKFDDALARLYRAIEVLGQVELKRLCGAETSNVPENIIPDILHEEFLQKYLDPNDSKIKTPLFGTFRLLKELGSDMANRFFEVFESELRSILDMRNQSILAHGFRPVEEKVFWRMWNSIIRFSNVSEENLPKFPLLKTL
jgi:CRISPR-associated protein (TIGR02710 family)